MKSLHDERNNWFFIVNWEFYFFRNFFIKDSSKRYCLINKFFLNELLIKCFKNKKKIKRMVENG